MEASLSRFLGRTWAGWGANKGTQESLCPPCSLRTSAEAIQAMRTGTKAALFPRLRDKNVQSRGGEELGSQKSQTRSSLPGSPTLCPPDMEVHPQKVAAKLGTKLGTRAQGARPWMGPACPGTRGTERPALTAKPARCQALLPFRPRPPPRRPGPALTSGLRHAGRGQGRRRGVLGLACQPLPGAHGLEHLEDCEGRHI